MLYLSVRGVPLNFRIRGATVLTLSRPTGNRDPLAINIRHISSCLLSTATLIGKWPIFVLASGDAPASNNTLHIVGFLYLTAHISEVLPLQFRNSRFAPADNNSEHMSTRSASIAHDNAVSPLSQTMFTMSSLAPIEIIREARS